ncbi:MAG TPA: HNH endonuclease [Polyangiaceae bacterium]|nr:HNH endonuclease [Polyangiaceae bacterium]
MEQFEDVGTTDGVTASELKPCLYCRDKARPKTAEHIMQRGLGGRACLHDEVCDECNSKTLSRVDGFLVRAVHDLYCRRHSDVTKSRNPLRGNHVVHRDERHSVWLSVRLDERMRLRIPDQLISRGGYDWHMSVGDDSTEDIATPVRRITDELRAVAVDNLSIVVVGDCEPPVEPALVRSGPGCFVVRAATREIAESLKQRVLERKIFSTEPRTTLEPQSTISDPLVHVRMHIEERAICRALAKIGLNVVCRVFGSEFARSADFDVVRDFILNGERDSEGIVELVTESERLQHVTRLMCPPNHHAVHIQPYPDGLYAVVALYQQPIATIRLTWKTPASPDAARVLFNYRRGGELLVYREFYEMPIPGDEEWDELARAS